MTDTEREYFHVMKNEFGQVNFGNFIDNICDYFSDLGIINFGKFTLPTHMIPWIDEFIQQSTTSSLDGFELMDLTDHYYFFKARDLYFYVTWKRVGISVSLPFFMEPNIQWTRLEFTSFTTMKMTMIP